MWERNFEFLARTLKLKPHYGLQISSTISEQRDENAYGLDPKVSDRLKLFSNVAILMAQRA